MRERLDRGAVVTAAAKLADERGFDGLNLAELAGRLGIKTPSLYNHVAGLADLRRELQVRAALELKERFAEACVGRAGEEALRALAHAYRRFAHERPGLYPALQVAPPKGDHDAEAVARAVVEMIAAVLRGWGLEGERAIHAVRAVRASLHGFLALEAAGGFGMPVDVDESFERLVDVLVRGLKR